MCIYRFPFRQVLLIVGPVDLQADGVPFHHVILVVVDGHDIEIVPPDQLTNHGDAGRVILAVHLISNKQANIMICIQ